MNKEQFRNFETFKDIEFEKERLSLQIQLAEEKINNNFNSLTEKLTFSSIVSEIKGSSLGMIYKAFRFGYRLFTRNKKTN